MNSEQEKVRERESKISGEDGQIELLRVKISISQLSQFMEWYSITQYHGEVKKNWVIFTPSEQSRVHFERMQSIQHVFQLGHLPGASF